MSDEEPLYAGKVHFSFPSAASQPSEAEKDTREWRLEVRGVGTIMVVPKAALSAVEAERDEEARMKVCLDGGLRKSAPGT